MVYTEEGDKERNAMERLTRTPATVFVLFAVAFYLTALGYVFEARGNLSAALVAAALAYLAAAGLLRAALRPVR